MYPYSTAGFQQCCVQCECVCVCPRQQERRGSYCISFNAGYSLQEIKMLRPSAFLPCTKKNTYKEREGGRGSHTWLNKSFSWIHQRETWATRLKLQEIKKPECALRKWKDKETGQNSCENLILIARGPQRDVCYSGYMCVYTYCYSHTEKP